MTRTLATAATLAAVLMLGACSGGGDPADTSTPTVVGAADPTATKSPKPAKPTTAVEIAEIVAEKVPTATGTKDLDENTDENDLLGRPGQYVSTTQIYDKGASTDCEGTPDAYCGSGAAVEVFETEADAADREEYLGMFTDSPAFAEYDYRVGNALLRVRGEIKPSVAKQYEAAFRAALA